ncbi:hypothetical protein DY000_02025025 [Brassica cretica]|uniref:Uncharacterized protein n=1 Tax=Brassica cretica TaxID=69181 RepID=A0ABQ7ED54_BRACR|nr:hypothetical protein DY000_02025025 [Brassica cretica]
MQCSRDLTCKHEPKDKPTTVSPLKRVNRSFSGTLSYDSPLRKKKKALTKSALNPSLGSGKTKIGVPRACTAKACASRGSGLGSTSRNCIPRGHVPPRPALTVYRGGAGQSGSIQPNCHL